MNDLIESLKSGADYFNDRMRAAAEIERLTRELAEARASNERRGKIMDDLTLELREARGLLDQIETLAVNDKTGCKTCTAIVNLICTPDQPTGVVK